MSLKTAIANMLARALVHLVDDTGGRQRLQIEVTQGEVMDPVERMQNYGLTSNPKSGSDGIIVFRSGQRDQAVAICVEDRRYRVKNLAPGEVCLYDDLGNKVYLKRDKVQVIGVSKVEASAPIVDVIATTINFQATNINSSGSWDHTGAINFDGPGTINGKVFDERHTHGGVDQGGDHTGGID